MTFLDPLRLQPADYGRQGLGVIDGNRQQARILLRPDRSAAHGGGDDSGDPGQVRRIGRAHVESLLNQP